MLLTHFDSYFIMLKRLFKNHASFLLIVFSAGCFFLSNVLFKQVLNPVEYGQYSLLLSYFSIVNLVGLLGIEQVFMRYSHRIENNVIQTQRLQLICVFVSIFVTTVLSVALFKYYFQDSVNISFTFLLLSTLAMISLLFIYNVFRLNHNFNVSQLVLSSWKIFLFFTGSIMFFVTSLRFETFLILLMSFIFLSAFFPGYFILRKLKFRYDNSLNAQDFYRIWYQFFISILLFTLLLFGERFIIENRFGIEAFGDYFYMTNLFIAPFALLQNYIGFKQLIAYKVKFDWNLFNRLNVKLFTLGIFISLLLYLVQWIFPELSAIHVNNYFVTMIFLLFLGINRMISSNFLAAFEAKTTREVLQKVNLFFIVFSIFIFALSFYFANEIWQIILFINVMWSFRTVVLYYYMRKLIPN